MPFVKSDILIKGDKNAIYQVIQNMEDYPRFMESLVSVTVLERGITIFLIGSPMWMDAKSSGRKEMTFIRKILK